MRAGQLRELVTIQQATTTLDAHGATVQTWPGTVIDTVWAAVRAVPRAQGESLQQDKVTALVDYEVEIRYRADVMPKMRLSWTPFQGTAKTLEIHAVNPKEGGREAMLLDCGEVVS